MTLDVGGDDLKLKVWDIRQGFEKPAAINKRSVFMLMVHVKLPTPYDNLTQLTNGLLDSKQALQVSRVIQT